MMKNILVSLILLFLISQVNAQVAIGLKVGSSFSAYTERGVFNDFRREIGTPNLNNNGPYETGVSLAAVMDFGVNKFIDIRIEPGVSMKNNQIPPDQTFLIDFIIVEAKRIYVEFPVKMKLRLPVIKDRLGVYSTVGINTIYNSHTLFLETDFQEREFVSADGSIESIEFKRLVGFGLDLILGKHQFFVDCDFSTKLSKHHFEDYRLKDLQLGVGYLYEL